MPFSTIQCARCTAENHPSSRFCSSCGLPLGCVEPDVEAAVEALGPYESPEPADPDLTRLVKDFVDQLEYDIQPAGTGWRISVPIRTDRRQAVYIGPVGIDMEGRSIIALVSVSGPANHRDVGTLLKLNSRAAEAHFAIKVLRGEEYFVVVANLPATMLPQVDPDGLIRRIALLADGLEERLSRGRDLF